jgi:hypothetical protein
MGMVRDDIYMSTFCDPRIGSQDIGVQMDNGTCIGLHPSVVGLHIVVHVGIGIYKLYRSKLVVCGKLIYEDSDTYIGEHPILVDVCMVMYEDSDTGSDGHPRHEVGDNVKFDDIGIGSEFC